MEFNYENASLHFRRTGAPRGFVWKFVLAYVVLSLAFYALFFFGIIRVFAESLDQASGFEQFLFGLIYLLSSLLFWSVFETAFLRRYMRGDRMKLRLGADEFRVFVVLLIWVAIFIAIAAGFFGLFMITAGTAALTTGPGQPPQSPAAILAILLLYFGFYFVIGLVGIRFGPAAAMTVRDRKIRFGDAWNATRGRWWTLFGCYMAWSTMAMFGYLIFIFLLIATGSPIFDADPYSQPPSAFFSGVFGFMILTVFTALIACFSYIWAGPAALAAKTQYDGHDPVVTDEIGHE